MVDERNNADKALKDSEVQLRAILDAVKIGIVIIDPDKAKGRKDIVDACPYGARIHDVDTDKLMVNAIRCQGCGSCAVACPNGASYLEGFSEEQMLEVIDAAMAVSEEYS